MRSLKYFENNNEMNKNKYYNILIKNYYESFNNQENELERIISNEIEKKLLKMILIYLK